MLSLHRARNERVARMGMTVVRVAQYVRMSTEHQQYSTENQSDIILEYAKKHSMEVVRTFADAGKSGLSFGGRDAIKELIAVVQSGKADFDRILVYDVSRWGRFQDADESAYYEYICKRAGIHVIYCAEQFENDGSPVSTIVKGVKRAMAGEYSRELSTKVFKGQCRLIELGYRQGGTAGYGLRRMLIDGGGETKGQLTLGEQKSIHTDRVILVPGPFEEQEVVRRIYKEFIEDRRNEREIADDLDRAGVLSERGGKWSRALVHEILTNEKYIGNNIFNRVSFKLKKKRVKNTPDMWVRRDEAFEPIVDPADFFTAQGMLLERHRKLSNDDLLQKLRALCDRVGRLSGLIISESEETPSPAVYRHRFGTLVRAYELIGYTPERDYSFIEINRALRRMHPTIVAETIASIEALGGKVVRDAETDLLTINGEFTASLVLSRCVRTEAGEHQWTVRLDDSLRADISIVVRMDATNDAALDYYLLPALDIRSPKVRLQEDNGIFLDAFRFDTLDYFIGMAERAEVAA
jgi:DNA invertase Pin-like site-specific DNA recombinase